MPLLHDVTGEAPEPEMGISPPADAPADMPRRFVWRSGVVLRIAALVHGRILTSVYVVWVCYRLLMPGPEDLLTLHLAVFLVLTYLVSLALFALLCWLAPRQVLQVDAAGLTHMQGKRARSIPWDTVERVEHSLDGDGRLVVWSAFEGGRRRLVLTEGFDLDAIDHAVHAFTGGRIPLDTVRPGWDARFLVRHWPLVSLLLALAFITCIEWLPRWLG